MAKDRLVPCKYYEYEGVCKKGHEGIFKKTCQHCKEYTPRHNDKVESVNKKKEILSKLDKDKKEWAE